MRKITKTHTGKIVSDTDLNVEYLYVGDYGKETDYSHRQACGVLTAKFSP